MVLVTPVDAAEDLAGDVEEVLVVTLPDEDTALLAKLTLTPGEAD